MIPAPSNRLSAIPSYPFAKLEERVRQKKEKKEKLLNFAIGDPDLPTPKFIVKALAEAAQKAEYSGYSSSAGEPWFRAAVAEWYHKRFRVELDPDTEVCALTGSKEGLANLGRAFLNPGDHVLCPDPGYPVYSNGATLLSGGVPVTYPVTTRDAFDFKIMEGNLEGCKLIYANFPHNPTGAVAFDTHMKALVDGAAATGALICYDNAYSEITFGDFTAPSILQFDRNKECSVEVHSCSKTFSMTGFRIGFAVGNREAIGALKKAKSQVDSGPPKFVQHAARVALESYEDRRRPVDVELMRRTYEQRLTLLRQGLEKLGLRAEMPKGTFYLWQKVSAPSEDFIEKLIQTGIVVTPGSAFGAGGGGYVRWAATQPIKAVEEAISLLERVDLR
jgi:LL-diaminopimelate aminotransferase